MDVIQTLWEGAYEEGWKGLITETSFSHPAKFSRSLIRRIYQHLLTSGYISAGATVVDPFGGVALGALDALANDLHWIGCELEPKFHALGNENLRLWRDKFGTHTRGSATLLQGDSRKLCEVIGAESDFVSSPPYAETTPRQDKDYEEEKLATAKGATAKGATEDRATWGHNRGSDGQQGYGSSPGQLGGMPAGSVEAVLSSPPFLDARSETTQSMPTVHGGPAAERHHTTQAGAGYGDTPGQLGTLQPGTVDAAISSPPYAESSVTGDANFTGSNGGAEMNAADVSKGYGDTIGQLGLLPAGEVSAVVSSPPFMEAQTGGGISAAMRGAGDYKLTTSMPTNCYQPAEQGTTPGQLSAMPAGDAIVSSPPYERSNDHERPLDSTREKNGRHTIHLPYGDTAGNVGNDSGETFWAAAKEIVQQCYKILKPSGIAVFVVKDFVRTGKRIPFSDDWRRLCEACGFRLVEWIKASLVKRVEEDSLFGGKEVQTSSRKSFFQAFG